MIGAEEDRRRVERDRRERWHAEITVERTENGYASHWWGDNVENELVRALAF